MTSLWQDLRLAFRRLLKSPGFSLLSILSLALAVGLITTLFSVVNAVLLRPLPVEEPDQLMAVYTIDTQRQSGAMTLLPTSFPNYEDFREHNEVFSGLAAHGPIPLSFSTGTESERLWGELVSGDYFSILGVEAQLGRTFLPEEDRVPGAHPVVVLAYGLWRRSFGADPGVIGRKVTVNGTPFTVIGVAPKGFSGVDVSLSPQLWVPTMMYRELLGRWKTWFPRRFVLMLNMTGRLRPGVSREQAESAMKALARRLEEEYPDANKGRSVTLVPLAQAKLNPNFRGRILLGLMLLMTVASFVLLIACTNIANMALARAIRSRRDTAVRLSLGARRSGIVRQHLTESVVMSLLGGLAGIPVALWARGLVPTFSTSFDVPVTLDLQLDIRVFTFVLGVTLLAGALFGLAPALRTTRTHLVPALKDLPLASGGVGRRGRRLRGRNLLVIAQVSLCTVALIGADMFIRSSQEAQRIDTGFDADRLAFVSVDLDLQGYGEEQSRHYFERLLDRLEKLPEVESAALSKQPPLAFSEIAVVEAEEREGRTGAQGEYLISTVVSPGYFETMGIPIVSGRPFDDALDREGSQPTAIVNQEMAQRLWPGRSALGKRLRYVGEEHWITVVGVAKNSKYVSLTEEPRPYMYVPFDQRSVFGMTVFVRTQGDPKTVLPTLEREVQQLDPEVPVYNGLTVGEAIERSLWATRAAAAFLSLFGLIAWALALIGLLGLLSYLITLRTQEIGLRMALGAQRAEVIRMISWQGVALVGAGVLLGAFAAYALARFASGFMVGISVFDPRVFAEAIAMFVLTAALAILVPAWRAASLNPMGALRQG